MSTVTELIDQAARLVDVVFVDSEERGIGGWYASECTIDDSANWLWNDRGNGPELIGHDDIEGPYPTESEAVAKILAMAVETWSGN
jgi:hypothetical protein